MSSTFRKDLYLAYDNSIRGVKDAVMNVMARSGLKAVIGERRFYATAERALVDLEAGVAP